MNPPSLELSHKKGHFPLWKMPSCNAVFCCMCRQRGVFCAGGVMTSGGLCPKGMRRQEGDMPRWTRGLMTRLRLFVRGQKS